MTTSTTSIMDADLDAALADLDAIVADTEESKPAKKAEKKTPAKKAEKKTPAKKAEKKAEKAVVEPVEDDADLEAALAELDEIETEAVDSKIIQGATEDDLEAALDDVEIEETKKASYGEQPAEELKEVVEAAKDVVADAEPKKSARSASTSAKGLEGSAAIRAKLGENVYGFVVFEESDGELSEADLKAKVDSNLADIDTLAKKVREKAVNLFDTLANNKTLSVFTQTAIDILGEKGSLTLKELKDEYMSDGDGKKPYSSGTASAQASQMMKLLPALKIAVREGSELRINESSALFPMLKK